jgi:N6-L-threonylcarbamoyladenine synthase
MNVLGIESSCDETAAAVVREDGTIISDVVASQVEVHAPYGGVVPELASRAHMVHVVPVVQQALAALPRGLDDVDAVAVTQGPGLVGALLVGVSMGKALAWSRGLPLVGVNHLDGHLFAVFLRRQGATDAGSSPDAPFVALLASGGHTALYRVSGPADVDLLGQTRDDAAGEAYDKVAKLLGLGYPGGPVIDRLAAAGNPRALQFPTPMLDQDNLDFSFAGLKTALAHHVRDRGVPQDEAALADICASFQWAAVEVLVRKSVQACRTAGVSHLVLTGGVAANRGLRARAAELCADQGVTLHVPPPRSCTDNAAMIAYVGACRLAEGADDGYGLRAYSRDPAWRRGRVI